MSRSLLHMAAAALVVAAACADSRDGSAAPVSTTTTTTAALAAPKVSIIAEIDAPDSSFVDVFGDHLTWTQGPARQNTYHDRLMVHDLRTGKTTNPVKAKKGTAIEWSRGSGDTIVYTEQDYGDDPETAGPIAWRYFKLDLTTGKTELLDHGVEADFLPTIVIDEPWIAWQRPTDVVAQDLRTGQRTTFLTNAQVGNPQVVDNTFVYVGRSSSPSEPLAQDVFAIDLPGGKPRKLTTSGLVYRVGKSSGQIVAYEEPLKTDPQRVLTVPLEGGKPTEITGEPNSGNIVTGDNFVAWWELNGPVRVAFVGHHPPSTVAKVGHNAEVPVRISADGKRLAWGEQTGEGPDMWDASKPTFWAGTIYVADVT